MTMSETTNAIQWKLQNFLTARLKRIFNIRWVEKIGNVDQWEREVQESLTRQMRRGKWGWIKHTLRKLHPASLPNTIMEPTGEKKTGSVRQHLETWHRNWDEWISNQLDGCDKSSLEQSTTERCCRWATFLNGHSKQLIDWLANKQY